MQQPNNDLAHIVRDDEVLKEERDLVDVAACGGVLQVVVGNIFRDLLSRRSPQQQLEHDGTDRVYIAHLGDSVDPLILFHQQKLLNLIAL